MATISLAFFIEGLAPMIFGSEPRALDLGMMARYTVAEVIVVGLIGERGREVKEFIEQILGAETLLLSAAQDTKSTSFFAHVFSRPTAPLRKHLATQSGTLALLHLVLALPVE